ncbi:cation:proton antiporter [Bailinhaonella thermotolerans]|uniref:Sodium:proton antiporter n=1 Tax=Bailinhaonella thermotolerans TaxID=1070861 RepID=A0A3A4BA80_9ACTN|nr:cation:proton antiporter [Bailinhaonella thermotolerans]RJL35483.1 sodium:proton antiporter [Bailinhaonella thermotolerans]
MEGTFVAVVGVISIVVIAAVSRRVGVAVPLALVVVGAGLGFLPGAPAIELEPEWVIAVVLPPLLYAAAVQMPAIDFRRDLRTIAGLAVLLVAVTALGTGYLFAWLLPGLGLAAAFALGAVVSPTDAVAATSIGRRLGLPSRLMTILEGEGLVNDASALVLLATATAAMSGTVHPGRVGLEFVWAVAAAVVIGAVTGAVTVRIRGRLNDAVLTTAMSFVVPFLAFLPAEEIGASGVLAVVVCGLVNGDQSPRFLRAADRLAETVNWRTVAFLLESGLFLVMGLQLHTLLDQCAAAGLSAAHGVAIGLAASLLAIVARVLFVVPLVSLVRRNAARAASVEEFLRRARDRVSEADLRRRAPRRTRHILRRLTRLEGDVAFMVAENFGWRGGAVLAWSGMRGAITVAAAQTLPEDTPYRPQLLLIAFVVALTTLLLQGLTLPAVIRILRVPGDDPEADRADYVALLGDLNARARGVLDDAARPDGTPYPPGIVERVRSDWVRTPPSEPPPADSPDPRELYRELSARYLQAQQTELLAIRATGAYNSRILTHAQRALDRALAQLQKTDGA